MENQPEYYGAYLGQPESDGNRYWWLMYYGSYGGMYDRKFCDCPFIVKRQFVAKNPKASLIEKAA